MVLKVTLEMSFQVFHWDPILGPILYNLFFNDFFYFILLATAHNFADDNTLACFSKSIQELFGSLESECEVALNWLNENKMIVNLGKF